MARTAAAQIVPLSKAAPIVNGHSGRKNGKGMGIVTNIMPRAGDNLSPSEWAGKVNAAYKKSTADLLETARLFREALIDLKGRTAQKEFRDQLVFGPHQAARFNTIAMCSVLYIPANMKKIPPSISLMYELAQIPEAELAKLFKKEDIHLNMTVEDAVELRNRSSNPRAPKNEKADEPEAEAKPIKEKPKVIETHVDEDDDDDEDDDGITSNKNETEYERKLNNWFNYLEGMTTSIGPLTDELEESKSPQKLPAEMVREAKRAIKLLEKLLEKYA